MESSEQLDFDDPGTPSPFKGFSTPEPPKKIPLPDGWKPDLSGMGCNGSDYSRDH
jgi:hypothetical protein